MNYDVIAGAGFAVPLLALSFLIPDERDGSILRPGLWAFGAIVWFAAFAISAVPEHWGWAIVWASIDVALLLIMSWVGFYHLGKRNRK